MTNSLSIGRSSTCDFVIPDGTCSKKNAILKLSEDKLYIEDSRSKFGTSIKLLEGEALEIG